MYLSYKKLKIEIKIEFEWWEVFLREINYSILQLRYLDTDKINIRRYSDNAEYDVYQKWIEIAEAKWKPIFSGARRQPAHIDRVILAATTHP